MSCEVIQTDKAPAAIGPYSQAIKAGPWLFVSGQIPLKPGTGELVGSDFSDQAKQALENLKNILESGGYRLSDVTAVDVYLTDMSQFGLFNSVYEKYFSAHKPARAVVEVKGLPKEALIEVKCIAWKHS